MNIPLMVQTVPSIEGISFSLDGRRFKTDADGLAVVSVPHPGIHDLQMLRPRDRGAGARVRFSRWSDGATRFRRRIAIDSFTYVEAGLQLSHPVKLRFRYPPNGWIDPSRIESLSLTSELGTNYEFSKPQTIWLPRSEVLATSQGLRERRLSYSVNRVQFGDANAISGEQEIRVTPGEGTIIELALYSVKVATRDLILGLPTPGNLTIEHPNGRRDRAILGADGEAVLGPLPRGEYHLQTGAGWLPFAASVSLPGAREIDLAVISYIDILLSLACFLLLMLGVGFVRRRASTSMSGLDPHSGMIEATVSGPSVASVPSSSPTARPPRARLFGLGKRKGKQTSGDSEPEQRGKSGTEATGRYGGTITTAVAIQGSAEDEGTRASSKTKLRESIPLEREKLSSPESIPLEREKESSSEYIHRPPVEAETQALEGDLDSEAAPSLRDPTTHPARAWPAGIEGLERNWLDAEPRELREQLDEVRKLRAERDDFKAELEAERQERQRLDAVLERIRVLPVQVEVIREERDDFEAELVAERQERRRLESALGRTVEQLEELRDLRAERDDFKAELEAERQERQRREVALPDKRQRAEVEWERIKWSVSTRPGGHSESDEG